MQSANTCTLQSNMQLGYMLSTKLKCHYLSINDKGHARILIVGMINLYRWFEFEYLTLSSWFMTAWGLQLPVKDCRRGIPTWLEWATFLLDNIPRDSYSLLEHERAGYEYSWTTVTLIELSIQYKHSSYFQDFVDVVAHESSTLVGLPLHMQWVKGLAKGLKERPILGLKSVSNSCLNCFQLFFLWVSLVT